MEIQGLHYVAIYPDEAAWEDFTEAWQDKVVDLNTSMRNRVVKERRMQVLIAKSTDFSHIAASCRQAYNGIRRPAIVLESCFNMNRTEMVEYIQFFYEDDRVEYRLTDEDLREIFYLLTDVYPEEVEDDPDLVQIISNLSRVNETKSPFSRIHSLMKGILDADDNRIRAMQMRSVLARLTARDAYWVILRLQR